MTIDKNEFVDSDGNPRSYEQRRAYRANKDRAKQLARASAAQHARENVKPISGHEGRISELKSLIKRSFDRREKEKLRRRLVQHEDAHQQWEADQAAQQWEEDFDHSSRAKLAADSIEAIRRSGSVMYPNASADQLDQLVALYEVRHEFPTPEAFGEEFFNKLGLIEDGEAAAAQKLADDNRLESERLQAESLRSQKTALEAQQRANQARSILENE